MDKYTLVGWRTTAIINIIWSFYMLGTDILAFHMH